MARIEMDSKDRLSILSSLESSEVRDSIDSKDTGNEDIRIEDSLITLVIVNLDSLSLT